MIARQRASLPTISETQEAEPAVAGPYQGAQLSDATWEVSARGHRSGALESLVEFCHLVDIYSQKVKYEFIKNVQGQ